MSKNGVLGIGNILLSDGGAGVRVIEAPAAAGYFRDLEAAR